MQSLVLDEIDVEIFNEITPAMVITNQDTEPADLPTTFAEMPNVCENRGERAPQHKISVEIREKVTSHINSFKPCTPHYRRKTAADVKYLPSSLTIQFMFDDFVKKNPDFAISVESYM
ncbi:hypothetical protein QYM36_016788 [Artemia franciscana]|uniref:Uncharacterized protein n=1 Tax=Artemia franciscana TaxID=6661 RepID=A0AA88HFB9_ARTSF|nr:hypothetical protein QYM36_016788 [Artemia franciscana]